MTQRQIWLNFAGLLALICLCAGWYWQSTGVRAIPALTRALRDEPSQARIVAAQGLAETGVAAKASVPDLLEVALHDPVQYAGAEAARALTRIDLSAARQVMASYLPLLQDQDVQGALVYFFLPLYLSILIPLGYAVGRRIGKGWGGRPPDRDRAVGE